MSDRYFTLMIVPERSDRVRKFTLPTLYLRLGGAVGIILFILGIFIFFDYMHVLSQIAENKKLRAENSNLREDVQSAKGKLDDLDRSVARIKTFAQQLRLLGNIDSPQSGQLLQAPDIPNKSGNGIPPILQDTEDSGTIEDPDAPQKSSQVIPNFSPMPQEQAQGDYSNAEMNAQPEHAPRLTNRLVINGEFTAEYGSANLLDQVELISDATIRLQEFAESEEQNLADLYEYFQDRADKLQATPSILPTRGYISSHFGYRYNPFSQTRSFHAGLDIANSIGTPIYAPANGTVTYIGQLGGFGNVVRIDHGYNIVTKYGHNSRILVKKGEKVSRGDRIAEMGNSGRSTGPHLHYQVEIKGKPVNPKFFFFESL
jgi:murein DD-endopeptidase MepM/ murein hydrolase activator NlpD